MRVELFERPVDHQLRPESAVVELDGIVGGADEDITELAPSESLRQQHETRHTCIAA